MKSSRIVFLHAVSIGVEVLGTYFIYMDSLRIEAGLGLGDLHEWAAWYYHWGRQGFAFLFSGILFQLILIFFQNVEHADIEERLQRVERLVQEKDNQPKS